MSFQASDDDSEDAAINDIECPLIPTGRTVPGPHAVL